MELDLDDLSKIAESATPGNWIWVNDRTPELIRAGKFPYTHVTYTDDVADEDSLFIATFDPPTVLALLSRLERLKQAEQAVQRVREALRDGEYDDPGHGDIISTRHIYRALDGDGRG